MSTFASQPTAILEMIAARSSPESRANLHGVSQSVRSDTLAYSKKLQMKEWNLILQDPITKKSTLDYQENEAELQSFGVKTIRLTDDEMSAWKRAYESMLKERNGEVIELLTDEERLELLKRYAPIYSKANDLLPSDLTEERKRRIKWHFDEISITSVDDTLSLIPVIREGTFSDILNVLAVDVRRREIAGDIIKIILILLKDKHDRIDIHTRPDDYRHIETIYMGEQVDREIKLQMICTLLIRMIGKELRIKTSSQDEYFSTILDYPVLIKAMILSNIDFFAKWDTLFIEDPDNPIEEEENYTILENLLNSLDNSINSLILIIKYANLDLIRESIAREGYFIGNFEGMVTEAKYFNSDVDFNYEDLDIVDNEELSHINITIETKGDRMLWPVGQALVARLTDKEIAENIVLRVMKYCIIKD